MTDINSGEDTPGTLPHFLKHVAPTLPSPSLDDIWNQMIAIEKSNVRFASFQEHIKVAHDATNTLHTVNEDEVNNIKNLMKSLKQTINKDKARLKAVKETKHTLEEQLKNLDFELQRAQSVFLEAEQEESATSETNNEISSKYIIADE